MLAILRSIFPDKNVVKMLKIKPAEYAWHETISEKLVRPGAVIVALLERFHFVSEIERVGSQRQPDQGYADHLGHQIPYSSHYCVSLGEARPRSGRLLTT